MDWQQHANERNCYCGVWGKDPQVFLDLGLTPGHCGKCGVCGAQGHSRHFPGAVPYTGGWCDRHYRRTAWLHPFGLPGGLVWAGGLGLVALAAIRLFA